MDKIKFKDKKKVSIFITDKQRKELKKRAIDKGVSLSQYLVMVGIQANE